MKGKAPLATQIVSLVARAREATAVIILFLFFRKCLDNVLGFNQEL